MAEKTTLLGIRYGGSKQTIKLYDTPADLVVSPPNYEFINLAKSGKGYAQLVDISLKSNFTTILSNMRVRKNGVTYCVLTSKECGPVTIMDVEDPFDSGAWAFDTTGAHIIDIANTIPGGCSPNICCIDLNSYANGIVQIDPTPGVGGTTGIEWWDWVNDPSKSFTKISGTGSMSGNTQAINVIGGGMAVEPDVCRTWKQYWSGEVVGGSHEITIFDCPGTVGPTNFIAYSCNAGTNKTFSLRDNGIGGTPATYLEVRRGGVLIATIGPNAGSVCGGGYYDFKYTFNVSSYYSNTDKDKMLHLHCRV